MDLIIDLFKYYARFVPKSVLEHIFIQPAKSRRQGYDQIRAEVLALPDADVIPDFDAFVISINENFISERIRSAKDYILFVEYGAFSVNHNIYEGVRESIAVSVLRNFSDANNDSVNELLHMNTCFLLLDRILRKMETDQEALDFCDGLLVEYPVQVQVVDPAVFYGCGGWMATFYNKNTIL
jgi:hypothetical protein